MTTGSSTARVRPMSAPDITARKRELRDGDGLPLVMVTAYDAPSARVVDAAGADMILVGDSLAMVVLGYDDTLQVTTDDMVHHIAAVARTRPRPLVVGDLPWLSYHVSREETVRNAATLVRAGAGAVKLEGGRKRLDAVGAILDAEIPVMGHLGLTPQSVHALGGFRVQGKQLDAARAIVDDAIALGGGGVLRAGAGVRARRRRPDGDRRDRHPDDRHRRRASLRRPGARVPRPARARGPEAPKFVRRYADLRSQATAGIEQFVEDVRSGTFPSSEETYHMTDRWVRPSTSTRRRRP